MINKNYIGKLVLVLLSPALIATNQHTVPPIPITACLACWHCTGVTTKFCANRSLHHDPIKFMQKQHHNTDDSKHNLATNDHLQKSFVDVLRNIAIGSTNYDYFSSFFLGASTPIFMYLVGRDKFAHTNRPSQKKML